MHGWIEVGDRVWTRRYEFADESVGVIEGDAGLVVVDTRASSVHGGELREHIREVSSAPLAAAVNTHGHWDHVWGNVRFTDIPIWAHERCPDFVRTASAPRQEELLALDLEADERAALTSIEVTPPTHLKDLRQHLDLGDRTVTLTHLGRGHTDHDIVVSCTGSDATFVGDLVKENGPPGYRDAFPRDWPATVDQLLPSLHGPVVVGHGRVVDVDFVQEFRMTIGRVAEALTLLDAGEIHDAEARRRADVHPRAFDEALHRWP